MTTNFTIKRFIIWISLNIIIVILMDVALFNQTTPNMENVPFLTKLGWAELWATLEWVFVIPANRMGNLFLTAPQLSLSSYVFDFLGQIGTNKYWLNVPTTLDDYIGMVIIFMAMSISAYKIFD
jgi:uncharacterized protein (DUF486 family)